MLTRILLIGTLCLLAAAIPGVGLASPSVNDNEADLYPQDVFVDVNWSGWNIRLVATGWMGFLGRDTVGLKHVIIDENDAIRIIDQLIRAGFLSMAKFYPTETALLKRSDDGTLVLVRDRSLCCEQVRIRLVIGRIETVVTVEQPIMTAPLGLKDWFEDFELLANQLLIGQP